MSITNTALSAAEAAKRVGLDKSTITRAIKAGKLSAGRDDEGRYTIEPSELARAFPDEFASVPSDDTASSSTSAATIDKPLETHGDAVATDDAHQWIASVRRELADMTRQRDAAEEKAAREREERERERRQLESTVDDLRARLDSSEAERRENATRLTALLSDQREKAEALPAKRRRLFGLLPA